MTRMPQQFRSRFEKKILLTVFFSLIVGSGSLAMSQVQFPGPKKGDKNAPKNLVGQVVDKDGKSIAEAVVYLKDKRTLEVQTHISDEKGGYRFSGLDNNTDYEVHAEFKGAASPKRAVSSFDNRKEIYLVLEIGGT